MKTKAVTDGFCCRVGFFSVQQHLMHQHDLYSDLRELSDLRRHNVRREVKYAGLSLIYVTEKKTVNE